MAQYMQMVGDQPPALSVEELKGCASDVAEAGAGYSEGAEDCGGSTGAVVGLFFGVPVVLQRQVFWPRQCRKLLSFHWCRERVQK